MGIIDLELYRIGRGTGVAQDAVMDDWLSTLKDTIAVKNNVFETLAGAGCLLGDIEIQMGH